MKTLPVILHESGAMSPDSTQVETARLAVYTRNPYGQARERLLFPGVLDVQAACQYRMEDGTPVFIKQSDRVDRIGFHPLFCVRYLVPITSVSVRNEFLWGSNPVEDQEALPEEYRIPESGLNTVSCWLRDHARIITAVCQLAGRLRRFLQRFPEPMGPNSSTDADRPCPKFGLLAWPPSVHEVATSSTYPGHWFLRDYPWTEEELRRVSQHSPESSRNYLRYTEQRTAIDGYVEDSGAPTMFREYAPMYGALISCPNWHSHYPSYSSLHRRIGQVSHSRRGLLEGGDANSQNYHVSLNGEMFVQYWDVHEVQARSVSEVFPGLIEACVVETRWLVDAGFTPISDGGVVDGWMFLQRTELRRTANGRWSLPGGYECEVHGPIGGGSRHCGVCEAAHRNSAHRVSEDDSDTRHSRGVAELLAEAFPLERGLRLMRTVPGGELVPISIDSLSSVDSGHTYEEGVTWAEELVRTESPEDTSPDPGNTRGLVSDNGPRFLGYHGVSNHHLVRVLAGHERCNVTFGTEVEINGFGGARVNPVNRFFAGWESDSSCGYEGVSNIFGLVSPVVKPTQAELRSLSRRSNRADNSWLNWISRFDEDTRRRIANPNEHWDFPAIDFLSALVEARPLIEAARTDNRCSGHITVGSRNGSRAMFDLARILRYMGPYYAVYRFRLTNSYCSRDKWSPNGRERYSPIRRRSQGVYEFRLPGRVRYVSQLWWRYRFFAIIAAAIQRKWTYGFFLRKLTPLLAEVYRDPAKLDETLQLSIHFQKYFDQKVIHPSINRYLLGSNY